MGDTTTGLVIPVVATGYPYPTADTVFRAMRVTVSCSITEHYETSRIYGVTHVLASDSCDRTARQWRIRRVTRIASVTVGRMWLSVVVSALMGCTNPDIIGPQPGFFGLTTGFRLNPLLLSLPPLPADSCPPFDPSVLPVNRRTIAGSSATVALPASTLSVPFADDRGVVFRIPGEGFIAVAYDDDLPVRLDFSDGSSRDPLFGFEMFRWCRVTVDGRAAELFVDALMPFPPERPVDIVFSPGMLLTTTTPAGRRVNITLEGAGTISVAVPPPVEGERNFAVRRLLSHAASIRW